MGSSYLILVLITISVCSGNEQEDSLNKLLSNQQDDFINEGNFCEEKLSKEISDLKTESLRKLTVIDGKIPDNFQSEINRKLNALENKIPEKLEEYLENKFNILRKYIHALDESTHEKIQNMEKNVINKLEDHVDEKLNSLEKHMNRKIDALEKLVADKTDINIINHKLDAFNIVKHEINETNNCQFNKSYNETSVNIEDILNQNFIKLEKNLCNNTNSHSQNNYIDENLINIDGKLKMLLPDTVNITRTLALIDEKISGQFEQILNVKLDGMEKIIQNLQKNISSECHTLSNNNTHNIKFNNHTMSDVFPELEQKMDIAKMSMQTYKNRCKELNVTGVMYSKPYIQIYNEILNHVTVRNDSLMDGINYFEMHFGVKSEKSAYILMSPNTGPSLETDNTAFEIGLYPERAFLRCKRHNIAVNTPNFNYSWTHTGYRRLYIKIDKGTLSLFSGDSLVLTHNDPNFKKLKYISFAASESSGDSASIIYDCPPNVILTDD